MEKQNSFKNESPLDQNPSPSETLREILSYKEPIKQNEDLVKEEKIEQFINNAIPPNEFSIRDKLIKNRNIKQGELDFLRTFKYVDRSEEIQKLREQIESSNASIDALSIPPQTQKQRKKQKLAENPILHGDFTNYLDGKRMEQTIRDRLNELKKDDSKEIDPNEVSRLEKFLDKATKINNYNDSVIKKHNLTVKPPEDS